MDEISGRLIFCCQIHVEGSSVMICLDRHDLIPITEKCHHTPPYPLFRGLNILAPALILPHSSESKEE